MKNNTIFKQKILDAVRTIPEGSVMSYGQVAELAGYPGAARAVGTLMKHNYDGTVPCHRVIKSDGSLGDYNRSDTTKKKMLEKEGITDFSRKNMKHILDSDEQ